MYSRVLPLLRRRLQCVGRRALLSSNPSPKLKIIFGSQTGTAEAFAYDLEFDASDKFETEIIDAQQATAQDLISPDPNTVHALILAVYGEGEPTDNAKKLYTEICNTEGTPFNCKYAVFGLGNSQCFQDRFNVVGKAVDERLHLHGGRRVIPLGLGDASEDISAQFADWKQDLLSHMENWADVQSIPSTAAPDVSMEVSPALTSHMTSPPKVVPVPDPAAAPSAATIPASTVVSPNSAVPIALSARQLAMAPEERAIFIATVQDLKQMFTATDEINSSVAVTFDVTQAVSLDPAQRTVSGVALSDGITAGDHIGVFAPQSRFVVESFAVAANIDISKLDQLYDAVGGLGGGPGGTCSLSEPTSSVTLRQVLTWQVQLSGLAPLTAIKVLHRWAGQNGMKATETLLQSMITEYEGAVRAHRVDITTVLNMIPLGPSFPPLPLPTLLKVLPAIAPRQYSVTHDPVSDPGHPSLLCRLLRYRDGRSCVVSGLCSSFLAERLHPHDHAAIFFRESSFHLPADPSCPVIMICGGTGIAPFLSFLKARSRMGKEQPLGKAVLYYGCRNTDEYMFRDQLLGHLKDGSLSKLVVSFSSRMDSAVLQQWGGHAGEVIRGKIENATDAVDEDAFDLADMVTQGGHLYVCGGAGHFGSAVRRSVEGLVALSEPDEVASAEDVSGVRLLIKQKRYYEDLAD